MTPNQAAKACMARLDKRAHIYYGEAPELEREFIEIISQVTPSEQGTVTTGTDGRAVTLHIPQRTLVFQVPVPQLDRFPQEIEEPRPRGWWRRWFL